MKQNRTGKIAMGGICTALAVIFMFGASFVPGIELTLFLISSLFTAVMVIEAGAAGGLTVFAAASLLGLILIPNKLALIPYIFCLNPQMLLIDTTPFGFVMIIITSCLGMFAVAAAVEGYMFVNLNPVVRIILAAAGLALMYPGTVTDIVGLAVICGIVVLTKLTNSSSKA